MPFFLEFSSYIAAFLVEDNVNIARILQLANRRLRRHDGLTTDCNLFLVRRILVSKKIHLLTEHDVA